MTPTLESLISKTQANYETLQQKVSEYKKVICDLCKAFPHETTEKKKVIQFGYYPQTFEGRKIHINTTGVGDSTSTVDDMVRDLIIENKIDDFLSELTEKIIPVHLSGVKLDRKYYF